MSYAVLSAITVQKAANEALKFIESSPEGYSGNQVTRLQLLSGLARAAAEFAGGGGSITITVEDFGLLNNHWPAHQPIRINSAALAAIGRGHMER